MQNNDMIYAPVMICDPNNYAKTYEQVMATNTDCLEKIEATAIKEGGLLHRFLYEAVADGKAIYQIIRVNKKSVRVRLCSLDGLYYDYSVPQWGNEATIPLQYAQSRIDWQNAYLKRFGHIFR